MFSLHQPVITLCILMFCQVQAYPRPNECIEHNITHTPGDEWAGQKGDCSLHKCQSDGSIISTTCAPVIIITSKCHQVPGDLDKLYPDCCARTICPLQQ